MRKKMYSMFKSGHFLEEVFSSVKTIFKRYVRFFVRTILKRSPLN